MSKFDKNLLFICCEDARHRLNDMAKLLKKSSQRLKYSTGILQREGIIHSPYCIFDYSYFGLLLFRVYFKGGYIAEKDKAKIIKNLSENNYIVAIYELNGEFDLVVEMLCPNPSRFGKEIKLLSFSIPTMDDYKIVLNQVTHLYPRTYLTGGTEITNIFPSEIIIGGDRKIEKFSQKELNLFMNLTDNPLINMSALAKKAELNVKTVVNMLNDLKQRKIIRGFKFVMNTNKLNIHRIRLFLKVRSISPEREETLMQYFLHTKEVITLNKTIGDWDMEVDVESYDKTKIRHLIVTLREDFRDLIHTFNSIEIYNYYKKSFLPKFMFTQKDEKT